MQIILNHSSMVPIYEQVVGQVKNDILMGALAPDTVLPSVRVLSAQLKISALTVKKAYDKLEQEGFIVTVHGKGSFVAPTNPELARETRIHSVQGDFQAAIDRAKSIGMKNKEIEELIHLLLEENL